MIVFQFYCRRGPINGPIPITIPLQLSPKSYIFKPIFIQQILNKLNFPIIKLIKVPYIITTQQLFRLHNPIMNILFLFPLILFIFIFDLLLNGLYILLLYIVEDTLCFGSFTRPRLKLECFQGGLLWMRFGFDRWKFLPAWKGCSSLATILFFMMFVIDDVDELLEGDIFFIHEVLKMMFPLCYI